jgi:hypothetical protein
MVLHANKLTYNLNYIKGKDMLVGTEQQTMSHKPGTIIISIFKSDLSLHAAKSNLKLTPRSSTGKTFALLRRRER